MTSMEEDFEVFVTHVRPQLTRALTGHLPAPEVGDAVAEALAYAWEHRSRVLAMDRPAGYLYRVAQSRSRRRKQGLLPWTADEMALLARRDWVRLMGFLALEEQRNRDR